MKTYPSRTLPVWVVEILCCDDRGRHHHWEFWDVHALRADARKQIAASFKDCRGRIRKYMPAPSSGVTKEKS